jgi:hypothetical protein
METGEASQRGSRGRQRQRVAQRQDTCKALTNLRYSRAHTSEGHIEGQSCTRSLYFIHFSLLLFYLRVLLAESHRGTYKRLTLEEGTKGL